MVDCSHANSNKDTGGKSPSPRPSAQIGQGDLRIIGVMVESHLQEGRQDLVPGQPLLYGHSITDACLGWEDSVNCSNRWRQAVAVGERSSRPADGVRAS